MLYLIMYFSIFVLASLLILCFTSINGLGDGNERAQENKEFDRFLKKYLRIFAVLTIISIFSIYAVKSTYYLEPVRVSENEIVSIKTNSTKLFCKYIDENGEKVDKEINLKYVDLSKYNKKENGYKIIEYVVYTKTDLNPTLFKILTFNHLPKEQSSYKIEK